MGWPKRPLDVLHTKKAAGSPVRERNGYRFQRGAAGARRGAQGRGAGAGVGGGGGRRGGGGGEGVGEGRTEKGKRGVLRGGRKRGGAAWGQEKGGAAWGQEKGGAAWGQEKGGAAWGQEGEGGGAAWGQEGNIKTTGQEPLKEEGEEAGGRKCIGASNKKYCRGNVWGGGNLGEIGRGMLSKNVKQKNE